MRDLPEALLCSSSRGSSDVLHMQRQFCKTTLQCSTLLLLELTGALMKEESVAINSYLSLKAVRQNMFGLYMQNSRLIIPRDVVPHCQNTDYTSVLGAI